MNLKLTGRAVKHVESAILARPDPRLIPALVWAKVASGPTSYFWGLFRNNKVITKEGWFVFTYQPQQRLKEWITDVAGIELSVSPEVRSRLEGKTLDFVDGHLQEL
jgi:Fe-S cluster assembly iron-binding protein IscA